MSVRGAGGEEKSIQSLVKQGPSGLRREAEKLSSGESRAANHLIRQFLSGNSNPGSGTRHIADDIYEMRNDGEHVVRVYYRIKDNIVQILGYSSKHNQDRVIRLILDHYT